MLPAGRWRKADFRTAVQFVDFRPPVVCGGELLQHLPPEDRITPIVGMLQGVVEKGGELRVEVADTNESKELMKFCRKFTVPLRAALRDAAY